MNFKLPDGIVRRKDAKRVCAELREMRTQPDAAQALENVSDEARTLMRGNQKVIESSGFSAFVDELEKTVQSAPVFEVILPTIPHDSFLADIGKWFRQEIHPNSLLEISVRRSIAGGMVLRSKNRLFDMSFRPQILAAKDKIPEVTRNV